MKKMISIEKLDLGIRFTDEELRKLFGGDDVDGGDLWDGVTIYSDPVTSTPGIYYNPVTGGHDSAAPSSGSSGSAAPVYQTSIYGDHHLVSTNLPKVGSAQNTQIPNYCVFQTIENTSMFFGGDVNPGTAALASYNLTGKADNLTTGFDGTVNQLNTLLSTYFTGSVTTDVKKSIDAGSPVMAYIPNATTGIGHDVMITGYNNDGSYSYYDPEAGNYAKAASTVFQDPFAATGLKK